LEPKIAGRNNPIVIFLLINYDQKYHARGWELKLKKNFKNFSKKLSKFQNSSKKKNFQKNFKNLSKKKLSKKNFKNLSKKFQKNFKNF